MTPPTLAATRPAETTAVCGFIALLIARALGVEDNDVITAIAGVLAFVPAGVTWLVNVRRSNAGLP